MCTEFRNAMYTKINNIEFIDMPDKEIFIYLRINVGQIRVKD